MLVYLIGNEDMVKYMVLCFFWNEQVIYFEKWIEENNGSCNLWILEMKQYSNRLKFCLENFYDIVIK